MKKYFLEIKTRALFIFFNFLINVFVIYFYKEVLLFSLIKSNSLNWNLSVFYFIFTDVTEILKIYIKIIVFFSCQIFILLLVYHVFLFLSPALYIFEYTKLKMFVKIFFSVWFFNIFLAHNFIIPITWTFFFNFHDLKNINSFTIHFEAKLSEFVSFYVELYYFSLFYVCMFFLLFLFINLVSSNIKDLKKFRKLYYFSFFFLSTIISPPDVLSQFILSFLLIILYEIIIFSIIFKANLNF